MFGDFLDKDGRYERCDEFLTIVRAALDRRAGDLRGQAPARRGRRAQPDPRPAARDLLRRLVAGGRPGRGQARRRLPHLGRAAGRGRREGRVDPQARRRRGPRGQIRFGIRLHTIARDTSEEAWAEADRLLAGISDEDDRPGPGRACKQSESVGQAPDARAQPGLQGRARDPPQPLGRRRPGPRRRRHRDGRQPRRDRRPDRAVPGGRHRRVRAVGLPAPGGVLLVRRGRAARAGPPRPLGAPGARSAATAAGAVRRRPPPGRPRDPGRRRRRQPEAAEPHARGRDVRRHRAGRPGARPGRRPRRARRRGCSTGRTRRSPSWSPRSGPPTWSSSRRRRTRRPTPGCSSSSSTGSRPTGCAASPCR